jgi:phosphoserine aminotransferase
MKTIYNFSAGPAMLDPEVMRQIQAELLDYKGTGMSIMEMSHRSALYEAVVNDAKANLKHLMQIPDNYEILFLQGGASLQFSMIPMNLMHTHQAAAYLNSGVWSQKAIDEAKRHGDVIVVGDNTDAKYKRLPECEGLPQEIDYAYYVSNNTIYGTQFKQIPMEHPILIADMSSDILSKPIDVSKHGLIFAGAQKNLGIAGVTIVIIRKDLIRSDLKLDTMLQYATHQKANSLYNTPASFSLYVLKKVTDWLLELGLDVITQRNEHKAYLLYSAIDQSKLFSNDIKREDRSLMNVVFTTNDSKLDDAFISFAKQQDCVNIKGYRSVGGMRASLYNAMPVEGVQKLIEAMHAFEAEVKP